MSGYVSPRLFRSGLIFALSFSTVSSLWLTSHAVGAKTNAAAPIAANVQPHGTEAQVGAQAEYGKLPTSFIANSGQIDPAVRFEVSSSAGSLFFTPGGVTLSLPVAASPMMGKQKRSHAARDTSAAAPVLHSSVAIRVTFADANQQAAIEGTDRLPGTANFFIGNDQSQWRTNVATYAGVTYRDLYPGIDLAYSGHAGTLKGTYTVAAGADPGVIRWQYAGADSTTLDTTTGNLQITAKGAAVTEQLPEAWQIRSDGTQVSVSASYQVDARGMAQFVLGQYDRAQPLIIDPGLVYSTYLGGSNSDIAGGVALYADGSAYIAGSTTSTNFPNTLGSYQPSENGVHDVFVTRLNAAGNALIFSTYIGGNFDDYGNAVAVDQAGYVYVTGETYSSNFPTTTGAYQTTIPGTDVSYVTELNPNGNSLYYSTFLGSNGGVNYTNGIAVDSSYNAYILGTTNSTNFPTVSAYQSAFSGGVDTTVTKLNNIGTTVIYSTYLGGTGYDYGSGIAIDSAGNAFITGETSSANFPVTASTYQTTIGGTSDAFVTKLNPAGSSLVFSTYLGGGLRDFGNSIALDSAGYIYVTGGTLSTNFPVSSGAYQTVLKGNANAFVTQLYPAGSTLYYSTYLGGTGGDYATGIVVNSLYEAIVTGITGSTDFPVTTGAFQTTNHGSADAFVTKLNNSGTGLMMSTYLGGTGADYGTGIALDSNGDSYVVGYTASTNFPLYQPIQGANSGGTFDAFVTKLNTLDGRIDSIGIYRAGKFYLRLHNSTGVADITVAFTAGTKPYPIVGDWTGAGFDTVGVYDQSNGLFSLRNTNTAGAPDEQFVLGNPNDQPLSGRWLLNATNAGAGVFRPSNGLIYLKRALATGYADYTMVLGIPGDVGLAGDWNGKGFDSPGVYRPGNSYFYMSNQVKNGSVVGDFQTQYGVGGDAPVVGDWVAQAHDGIGLFRQSNGFTYLKNVLATGYADNSFTYGVAGDIPVAGHWQATYPPMAPPGHPAPPPVLITKTPVPGSVSVTGDSLIGD